MPLSSANEPTSWILMISLTKGMLLGKASCGFGLLVEALQRISGCGSVVLLPKGEGGGLVFQLTLNLLRHEPEPLPPLATDGNDI